MNPLTDLQTALQQIGLGKKQVAVYLACLTLGPSSVQRIARKARIPRATTYVILEGLLTRGLVSRYKSGKRAVITAQQPEELVRLVELEQKELQQQKENIQKLLPVIKALSFDSDKNLTIQYYEGLQGLKMIRHELTRRCGPQEEWKNLVLSDDILKVFGMRDLSCQQRIAKRIRSRTLFSAKDEKLKAHLLAKSASHLTQRRPVNSLSLDSSAGITICGDYVAFGLYKGRVGGVLVDSVPISSMLSQFFDLVWNGTKNE